MYCIFLDTAQIVDRRNQTILDIVGFTMRIPHIRLKNFLFVIIGFSSMTMICLNLLSSVPTQVVENNTVIAYQIPA